MICDNVLIVLALGLYFFFFLQWATLTRSGANTVRMSRRWASMLSPWRILQTTTGTKTVKERDVLNGVAGTADSKCIQVSFCCSLRPQDGDSYLPTAVTCHCHFHSKVWLLFLLPQCLSRIFFGWRDEKNVRKGWETCHACHGSDCTTCKCPTLQYHPQVSHSRNVWISEM